MAAGTGGKRRLQFFGVTTAATTAGPGTTAGGTTVAGPVTIDDLADIHTILTFEELYEILQGNNANPRPSNIGDGWNNINIVYILQHYSKPTPWVETLWGQLVAGLSGVLLMFFVVILLYSIYQCGTKNKAMRRPPWWYFRPRTPSPAPPPAPAAPAPPPQPQIYFLNVGGGGPGGGGGGGEQGPRSPRHDKMTNMVHPLPPVYTPTPPEDSPEPVYYHVVHSARGES